VGSNWGLLVGVAVGMGVNVALGDGEAAGVWLASAAVGAVVAGGSVSVGGGVVVGVADGRFTTAREAVVGVGSRVRLAPPQAGSATLNKRRAARAGSQRRVNNRFTVTNFTLLGVIFTAL